MQGAPEILDTRRLRDAWPPISVDRVRLPSGREREWIRLHFGTSAAVLAVTSRSEVILTKEYRHGLGRIIHGLPGGVAKDEESPAACAGRELVEETGYEAPRLVPLYDGNNLTGYLEGSLSLFYAGECIRTDREPDPDEIHSVELLKVSEALGRARRGDFESSVLTLAILLADVRGLLPV